VKILFTVSALADKAKAAIAESKKPIELITIDETPGLPRSPSIADRQGSAGGVDRSRERLVGAAILVGHDRPAERRDAHASQRRCAARTDRRDSKASRCRRCSACCRSFTSTDGDHPDAWLHARATIVTMPKFEFEPFLKVLQDWPITSAAHRAADRRRARQASRGRQLQFPHLKYLFSGAAPLGPELTEAVEKRSQRQDPPGLRHDRGEPGDAYTVAARSAPEPSAC
jgi:hypothetical protein